MINTIKKLRAVADLASYVYKLFPKKKNKLTIYDAFNIVNDLKYDIGANELHFLLLSDRLIITSYWGGLKFSFTYSNEALESAVIDITKDYKQRTEDLKDDYRTSHGQ